MLNSFKNYSKNFLKRCLISLFVLVILIACKNNTNINLSFLNKNINILKPIMFIQKNFGKNNNVIGDNVVYKSNTYESVIYDNFINHIENSGFNGVVNLTDGIVVKIEKQENNLFNISILNSDDYLFRYANLKSFEVDIYSFIEFGTILGESILDKENNCYKFDLIIEKEGEYFSYYELAKD